MAAPELGSVTVTCPVCKRPLTLKIEARRVIHSTIGQHETRMTAKLHVELPDFDDLSTYPEGHEPCFSVSKQERTDIAAYEAAAPRDPEDV
jgi:hypothetical protein